MPRPRPLPLLALMAMLAGPTLAEDGPAFLEGVEDLPLMPGLHEVDEASVVFDAASGRIVEAYAAGAVAREEVLAFYGRTLPELGWTAEQPARYRRGGETLELEFLDGRELTVRFTLSPD